MSLAMGNGMFASLSEGFRICCAKVGAGLQSCSELNWCKNWGWIVELKSVEVP